MQSVITHCNNICPTTKIGDVALSFVEWVISEAKSRKIETLYFLSRDGYILKSIAQRICENHNINIECRYLYCSRCSLRLPSYHVSSKEIDKYLFSNSCKNTPNTILSRLLLSPSEKDELYKALDISLPDKEMKANELADFVEKLKKSDLFLTLLKSKAASSYTNTIAYFRQEGLLSTEHIAIVDSGWNGTMQSCLSVLLKNEGFTGKLTGFYFGLYSHPDSNESGNYLAYYFRSGKKDILKKSLFNCYAFESIFTADHGMTLGYIEKDGILIPEMAPYKPPAEMTQCISEILKSIKDYTDKYINANDFGKLLSKKARTNVYKNMKKILYKPSEMLADYFTNFRFCDDVTESYSSQLCSREQIPLLKKYMFVYRFRNKLLQKPAQEQGECYWPYGTAAFCGVFKRRWIRWNILIMEYLRLHK